MMPRTSKTKYVFRGTTVGWPGNPASWQLPRTPTTTNPVKALLFALCCRDKSEPAVIYFARAEKLRGVKKDKNVLAKVEEEVGYIISPTDFITLCDGCIFVTDCIEIFKNMGIYIPFLFDRSQLDMALKDAVVLSDDLVEKFYHLAQPYFQNT